MSKSATVTPAPWSPTNPNPDPLLFDQFLAPVQSVLTHFMRGVRTESPLNDVTFTRFGIQRVLTQSVSGRDFLQQLDELHDTPLARATFFDALHSRRREEFLEELNTQVIQRYKPSLPDLLAAFPALAKCPVYAVDGHHVAHAVHAHRATDGEHVSANSLYLLDLHSGLLQNIGAVQGDGVRRHEMPVFRRQIVDWLRRRSPARGAVPILAVDPAFHDHDYWICQALVSAARLRMIIPLKANMKPLVVKVRLWDPLAAINSGVQTDETVSFNGRDCLRLVRYIDPESGYLYEFLTTVMDLPPGLIALLYLLRWRIEKVFDTAKNKLQEKKAWATGTVAQNLQTHLIALTHNLLVIFRETLSRDHGIREVKIETKRAKALVVRQEIAVAAGRTVAAFVELLPRVIQLTAQYIRVLRNGIIKSRRWLDSLPLFRKAMEKYL